jgi:tetratricopeptide (TPR) repeat protein
MSLVLSSVFTQNPPVIGPPEDGPLECALNLAQNSSNKVFDMMKIALVYTSAKQYAQSLYLTGIIGNDVFTESYILPAIVWGYGMDQKYSQARPVVDSIKNPQAKLVAVTWLAKAYIAHHQDAVKLFEEAARMVPALMEEWLRTLYTPDNYIDFLKRVDALVNLSEAGVQTGRKSNANRINNLVLAFIRAASLQPGMEFLKGVALEEVAVSRYQSGYRTVGIKLMAEAEKYIAEGTTVSANGPLWVELATAYAKIRKFDNALRIAGLLRNEAESYDRADCLEKIGAEYDKIGQKVNAIAIWQRILTEIPDSDIPGRILWQANVGVDFYGAGRAGEAKELLRRALEITVRQKEQALKDDYPEALMMIVGKYREIGERDIALRLMDEIYEVFKTLYLQDKLEQTPNQLLTGTHSSLYGAATYCRITTIQALPTQVRTDLLGINLATEFAQLGVPLRALQIIRLITLVENKVEGLIWVGKTFLDDGITVNDEMRKLLGQIVGEATQEKG